MTVSFPVDAHVNSTNLWLSLPAFHVFRYAMATEALTYTAAFDLRCNGMNNGSVPALPTPAADNASLTSLLTTGGNLYAGLANVLTSRYSAASAEPIAKTIAAIWASLAEY